MRGRIVSIILILLLLALAGGGYWYLSSHPQAWDRLRVEIALAAPEAERAGVTASGFIEVPQVAIAPEVKGRIVRLTVDEGAQVRAGQVLAEIDADLLDAQITEAEAAAAIAEAQLARVKAAARAEDIAVAEATVVIAEAERDAAYQRR